MLIKSDPPSVPTAIVASAPRIYCLSEPARKLRGLLATAHVARSTVQDHESTLLNARILRAASLQGWNARNHDPR